MPNEIIFVGSVLVFLGLVLLVYKLMGKNGLYAFSVFATLLSNIAAYKSINLFGLPTTAGNVFYASTFLITDILSEKYGKRDAGRAVKYGFTAMLLWLLGSQAVLMFTPNANDFISSSLAQIFGLVPRITLASVIGYLFSQKIDVFLYHFIWGKTGNDKTKLWLRNNGSTLISQGIDTILFVAIAFWGAYPINVFFSILITTYVFKAIVALADTPFMYLARMIDPMEE